MTEEQKHEAELAVAYASIAQMNATVEKMRTEGDKMRLETKILPANAAFQAMLATAALLGAGAALAKVFFP